MSIVHKMMWRYATKKFDKGKKVSEEDITELLKAMNLSASPSGLQPYTFIVIRDKKLQAQLQKFSHHQTQITDASHLIVIAVKRTISRQYIKEYIQRIAEIREIPRDHLLELEESLQATMQSKTPKEQLMWAQRQAYLALGTLLIAAADLKIDVYPTEDFIQEAYDRVLGLTEKGLVSTVIAAVGYRDHTDRLQYAKKVRKKLEDIVHLYYNE